MSDDSVKLSEHLEAVARLMDLDAENPHKIRAYLNASLQVRGRTNEELRTPMKIPGVGPSIGATIKEFFIRGTSTRLEDLSTRWPVEILSLMNVPGVGPKTAGALFEQGITSFEELVFRAHQGELSASLTKNVLSAESQAKRVPIEIALTIANRIKNSLLSSGVKSVEICGSIRRHTATCKDIDIVVEHDDTGKFATDAQIKRAFEQLGQVLWSGPIKSAILVNDEAQRIQCDLWIVNRWHWGAALNYATGNKMHNQRVRGMLKSRGMRMNEYGIYLVADGVDLDARKTVYGPEVAMCGEEIVAKHIGGTNEEDVYKILGIPYVQPSQRSE